MAEPNRRLRNARERLPSPLVPGERLSRAELARMVNAWLWENTSRRFELDDHLVGKWERGVVRCPGGSYRAALRAVLGVGTDAELGFARAADAAQDAHGGSAPASEPHWLRGFDAAELVGTIGARYRDLARHDPRQAPRAVAHLDQALAMRGPDRARNRAFDLVSLGRACLITGELDRAAAAVRAALPYTDARRPGRLHRKVREWHGEAAGFGAVVVVAETRDLIKESILARTGMDTP